MADAANWPSNCYESLAGDGTALLVFPATLDQSLMAERGLGPESQSRLLPATSVFERVSCAAICGPTAAA